MADHQGLLLAAVCCDPSAAFVRLYNAGPDPISPAGFVLEWHEAPLRLPDRAPLASGESAYVAWDAAGFERFLTRKPDWSVGSGLVPLKGAPQALRPEGGAIRLLAPTGEVLDALVWGDGQSVAGWQGPALPAGDAHRIHQRAVQGEPPVRFVTETGSAAAWRQGGDWLPRREVRLGQSEWPIATHALPGALTFACPDSAFAAISQVLDGATKSLDINLYLFTHPGLADRVLAAHERGVRVRLLMEGEPYGFMPPSNRENLTRLQAAGVELRAMHATPDGFKRYRYNHAKYAIVDGRHCIVTSDNWTNTSMPAEPLTGNRGWGVALESPELATHLTAVFEGDWNPASPDSSPFDPARVRLPAGPEPIKPERRAITDPVEPEQVEEPIQATIFLAPEHGLLEEFGICGLIRSATKSLDVQQDYIQLYWAFGNAGSMETTPSLFLAEVVAAAKRGVQVRVLLDGSHLDAEDPRDNTHTQTWLQSLEGLKIETRILDHRSTQMGIHNKGIIVDGRRVLISSINWSQNSPLSNREMGLILESAAVGAYFGRVFERDWSGGK